MVMVSCCGSQDYMTDPVVAVDGNTYQRAALEAWINKCQQGEAPSYNMRHGHSSADCGWV